eukprot:849970-Alexandrium_andersonii.AAC.1
MLSVLLGGKQPRADTRINHANGVAPFGPTNLEQNQAGGDRRRRSYERGTCAGLPIRQAITGRQPLR